MAERLLGAARGRRRRRGSRPSRAAPSTGPSSTPSWQDGSAPATVDDVIADLRSGARGDRAGVLDRRRRRGRARPGAGLAGGGRRRDHAGPGRSPVPDAGRDPLGGPGAGRRHRRGPGRERCADCSRGPIAEGPADERAGHHATPPPRPRSRRASDRRRRRLPVLHTALGKTLGTTCGRPAAGLGTSLWAIRSDRAGTAGLARSARTPGLAPDFPNVLPRQSPGCPQSGFGRPQAPVVPGGGNRRPALARRPGVRYEWRLSGRGGIRDLDRRGHRGGDHRVRPSPPCSGTPCGSRRDQVALRAKSGDGWRELTYGEYGDRACRLAAGLAGLGVRRGDRVVLMMRNRPEFHVADIAVVLLGATPISIYNSSSAGPGPLSHGALWRERRDRRGRGLPPPDPVGAPGSRGAAGGGGHRAARRRAARRRAEVDGPARHRAWRSRRPRDQRPTVGPRDRHLHLGDDRAAEGRDARPRERGVGAEVGGRAHCATSISTGRGSSRTSRWRTSPSGTSRTTSARVRLRGHDVPGARCGRAVPPGGPSAGLLRRPARVGEDPRRGHGDGGRGRRAPRPARRRPRDRPPRRRLPGPRRGPPGRPRGPLCGGGRRARCGARDPRPGPVHRRLQRRGTPVGRDLRLLPRARRPALGGLRHERDERTHDLGSVRGPRRDRRAGGPGRGDRARRGRRGPDARGPGLPGLPRRPGEDGRDASTTTGGCTRATSACSTTTATCASSTARRS